MISCVIRTFNEKQYIGELLNILNIQSIGKKPEIIIVDSGSADGTIDIVKKYDVKLIQIKKEEFNYSYALNLGIENCSNELIAILSGHSIPSDESWMGKMISHFDDSKTAAVYSRQIPLPNADPYEVLRLERMFGKSASDTSNFSNAACFIRKSIWQQHPFVIMPAAEDKEWANWAVNRGYKIIYEPDAEVYHSHNESCRKAAERIIQIERAGDLSINRQRNILITLKQSAGMFVRDISKLPMIQLNACKKLALIRDCAARSFWYAYDFNRKE